MPRPTLLANDEAVIQQVAALAATGANISQIAEQIKTSRYHIKRLLDRPDCKELMKEIGESAVSQAKAMIRSKTSELAEESMRVIRARLEDDDLEAVKLVFKVIGFEANSEPQGDTHINVVLPGQDEKLAIEVEHRPIEEAIQDDDQG